MREPHTGRRPKREPLSDREIRQALSLRSDGWSWDRIAVHFGCSSEKARLSCDPEARERRRAAARESIRRLRAKRAKTGYDPTAPRPGPLLWEKEKFTADDIRAMSRRADEVMARIHPERDLAARMRRELARRGGSGLSFEQVGAPLNRALAKMAAGRPLEGE